MVRLCDASQWLLLCKLISSSDTVSSFNSIPQKTTLAVWRRIPYITPLLYKVYLPITEGFVELWHYVSCTNSWALVWSVQTFIDIQPCEWCKETFVWSVINRYVTIHHRSSFIPSWKACSKSSWSCMGTLRSTMLTAPLRWGRVDDETGDWIPLWTTLSDVNIVCMGLTKCNCKRTVPVIVAATKPHLYEQSSVHICWPV